MKKVIVTGASGFIGKALTKKLLEDGKIVYAVVRNKNSINDLIDYNNLIPIETDLENINILSKKITDIDIDTFFHLANYAKYPEENQDYSAQLRNTKFACDTIVEAVKVNCKKFILIGTSYQYQKKNNSDDPNEYRKCSIYGAGRQSAQLMCEILAHNNGINFNTVLLTNCYGVGDASSRSTNSIIHKLLSGDSPNLIEGNNNHDWVYIDDFINGLIATAEKGKNFKTYYIGSRRLKTFKEIIEGVRDAINPNINLKFGTYNDTSYIDYSKIDLDALYNDTGYECQSDFKENIKKTANWVKKLKF